LQVELLSADGAQSEALNAAAVAAVAVVAAAVEAGVERSVLFSRCVGSLHSREWFPRKSSTQSL
jgi:hypothetical protein